MAQSTEKTKGLNLGGMVELFKQKAANVFQFRTIGAASSKLSVAQSGDTVVVDANTGSSAGTLCAGDDARLSNARTPTAHASTHISGGSDPVDHDQLTNLFSNEHIDHSTVSITAGTGLSGGGDITTSRTLTINPAQVDHDALQNFVANEHIDHSAVSITPTSPLTGGGTIAANRNIGLSITSLSDIGSPALNDELLVYDVSASDFKKVTADNIRAGIVDPDFERVLFDDFVSATTTGNLGWTATVSGTGASTQVATSFIGSGNALGIIQLDTGTTATGRACLDLGISQLLPLLGNGWNLDLRMRASSETSLSTGTERYAVHLGFGDHNGAGATATDGVWFRYRDDLSANWQCVTAQAGVTTIVDSGVAAVTSLRRFRIHYTDGLTPQADFYINDALVASITTTLPYNAGNNFGILMKIEKSLGTAQRNLSVDYTWCRMYRTTNR